VSQSLGRRVKDEIWSLSRGHRRQDAFRNSLLSQGQDAKGLFSWATNWYLEHRPQLLMAANLYVSIEFDETLF
jgi:hypothetical protein